MSRTRMLVVEEHPIALTLALTAFRLRGYETFGATTPDDAVDAVRNRNPQVILLEWAFRAGGGDGLAARLREASPCCQLIVIAMSVADEWTGLRETEGFDDYYVKPAPMQDIDVRIRELLAAASQQCA